jgi:diguanylate cyclase (GGDEF)-like protein
MVDMDYFKEYNDLHGHLAGDEALKKIATLIEMNVKRGCDLVARFGGDEFIVLLSNTDSKGAAQVADAIIASVRNEEIICEDALSSQRIDSAVPVI